MKYTVGLVTISLMVGSARAWGFGDFFGDNDHGDSPSGHDDHHTSFGHHDNNSHHEHHEHHGHYEHYGRHDHDNHSHHGYGDHDHYHYYESSSGPHYHADTGFTTSASSQTWSSHDHRHDDISAAVGSRDDENYSFGGSFFDDLSDRNYRDDWHGMHPGASRPAESDGQIGGPHWQRGLRGPSGSRDFDSQSDEALKIRRDRSRRKGKVRQLEHVCRVYIMRLGMTTYRAIAELRDDLSLQQGAAMCERYLAWLVLETESIVGNRRGNYDSVAYQSLRRKLLEVQRMDDDLHARFHRLRTPP